MSIIFNILVLISLLLTTNVKTVSAALVYDGDICPAPRWCSDDGVTRYSCIYSSNTDLSTITTLTCPYGCTGITCNASTDSTVISRSSWASSYCYHSDGSSTYVSNCKQGLRCVYMPGFGTFFVKSDSCCPTGQVVSESSIFCVNGCRQANSSSGNVVSRSTTEYSYSYCFVTSPTNCTLGGNLSAHASGNSCTFDGDSTCICTSTGWDKWGYGCHNASLNCNNSNGWYNTCTAAWGYSSSNCDTTTISCSPCGNSSRTCHKKKSASSVCSVKSDCGSCEICSSGSCVSDPACSSCTYQNSTDRTTCLNWGGTCGNPADYNNPVTSSGLCTGSSSCICVKEGAVTCQAKTAGDATTCANWGGSCGSTSRFNSPVTYSGLCTGGSECVCSKEGCTPNCSASSNTCSGQTFSDGCGGTCTGTKQPDCSGAATVCSGTTYNATCGTCTGTKAIIANDIGTCGTAATGGGVFSSPPAINLCADGDTPSAVSTGTNTYSWTCTGVDGICVAAAVITTPCSAVRDNSPTFSSFILRNINNTDVDAESGNNHICQSAFTGTASPTTARFVATYSDLQGGADISNIQLTLGSQIFNPTSLTRSGNNATAIFDIATVQISSNALQSIILSASDANVYAGSVVSVDTGRDFKYWNCSVSTTGTAYDGSSTDSSCSDSSFSSPASIPYSLSMVNVSGGASQVMDVDSPNYSGSLAWGDSYIFNPTIGGNNFKLRFNNSTASCTNSLQFIVNNSNANPYSSPVQLDADFTSVLNQEPWWQVINGGAISNSSINNRVPITCTTANCKMSPSGLVSAQIITNPNRNITDIQPWYYQSPNAKLVINNTNYSYFFNEYYSRNEIGTVINGDKTINSINDLGSDPNNIYFINGNLTINGSVILGARKFLMIIVNGDITVNNNVNQVDGILVANNITASGSTNNTQLQFNGSLYVASNIDFSRSYATKSINNTSPAIVVNHNPQMIFNFPGSLSKVLTNWQWGN